MTSNSPVKGRPGGSGGGSAGSGGGSPGDKGSGNTPTVSPSQGFPGGIAQDGPNSRGAGGGGAGAAAADASTSPSVLLQEAVVAVELVFRRQLEEQVELVVVVPELLQEMEQTEQIILVAEVGVHKVVIQAA